MIALKVKVWKLQLHIFMQWVPIITNGVSWIPASGEVYLIQLNVIKFVRDL